MGDAQAYMRTATFNADVAAFFTKWIDDVDEAQHRFGAYPRLRALSDGAWRPRRKVVRHRLDGRRHHLPVDGLENLRRHAASSAKHWAAMTRFMEWRFRQRRWT
jgi:hypothetical protein